MSSRYRLPAMVLGLAVLVAWPAVVQAKPKHEVLVTDIDFDVEVVERRVLPNGHPGLRLAATGSGIVDCNGVQACIDRGFHGATATIDQDIGLEIVIDVINAGIKGATTGTVGIIDPHTDPWGFKGTVRGFMPGNDSEQGEFQLSVKARAKQGRKLALELTGVFRAGNVESLGGSGVIEGLLSRWARTDPIGTSVRGSVRPIDVAAVLDSVDQRDVFVVEDFADDPVVAAAGGPNTAELADKRRS